MKCKQLIHLGVYHPSSRFFFVVDETEEEFELTKIFNDYFATQCRPLLTNSILPPLSYKTENRLSSIPVNADKIQDVIKKLDSKKAHGYDGIAIAMLKLCSPEISSPCHSFLKMPSIRYLPLPMEEIKCSACS